MDNSKLSNKSILFHRDDILKIEEQINKCHVKCILRIAGNYGVGKTQLIKNTLDKNNIKFYTIRFSKYDSDPYEPIREALNIEFKEPVEECFYSWLDSIINSDSYIIFENYEYVMNDCSNLILRYINFRNKALMIFETNMKKPMNLDDYIWINEVPDKEIGYYLTLNNIIHNKLQDEIIHLVNGNLRNLHLVLSAITSDWDHVINNLNDFPRDMYAFFIKEFEKLKEHIKETVCQTHSVGLNIYSKLTHDAICNLEEYQDLANRIEYLTTIAEETILIEISNKYETIYNPQYYYVSDCVKDIFMHSNKKTAPIEILYNYLIELKNSELYDKLSIYDQIRFIKMIINIQNISHIVKLQYLPELFEKYELIHADNCIIDESELILKGGQISSKRIYTEFPKFFRSYFKSLINIGRAAKVVEYKEVIETYNMNQSNNLEVCADCNFLLSLAYYNTGFPKKSLTILKSLEKLNINKVKIYSLMSSAYDWCGIYDKSLEYFKRALVESKNKKDEYTLHKLYSKYSMYIDNQIPECINKLRKAVEFFSKCDRKSYADSLHNLGTDLVLNFKIDEGLGYLKMAESIYEELCIDQTYETKNSIAIANALNGEFNNAIQILESCVKGAKNIDYCYLSICNNLCCLYNIVGNDELLVEKLRCIESFIFSEDNQLRDVLKHRQDISNQIGYFYLNMGIFNMKTDTKKSLKYLRIAIKCCNSRSPAMFIINYYIQQLKGEEPCSPTNKLHKYYVNNNIYLSHMMAWGC